MNDLKRCPFCGSAAQLLIVPGRVAHWVVKCSKGCCNTCQHISDHDAEEAWNKRTAEEHPEIVRCKDCKNAVPAFDGKMSRCKIRGLRKNDWFCADGERKEGVSKANG